MTEQGFHGSGAVLPAGRHRPIAVIIGFGAGGVQTRNPDRQLIRSRIQVIVRGKDVGGGVSDLESVSPGLINRRMSIQVVRMGIVEEWENETAPKVIGLHGFGKGRRYLRNRILPVELLRSNRTRWDNGGIAGFTDLYRLGLEGRGCQDDNGEGKIFHEIVQNVS